MFTLPSLPYAYNALEPFFDEATMTLHHTKHHQTYVDKLNAALEYQPEWLIKPIEQVLKEFNALPADLQTAVRNHGGGHANHSLFWTQLGPQIEAAPIGTVAEAITKTFGSFDVLVEKLNKVGLNHFGSGWAWLVRKPNGALELCSTPNQDSPILQGDQPVLGIDVWEHAYYLKYQNRRVEYLDAFWKVVNWAAVERHFVSLLG